MQLWDSDQTAADGDLGFIDIGLNEVMQNPNTNEKMLDRRDKLHMLSTKEDIPCTLDWSLGYFSKTRIPPTQPGPQTDDQSIENIDDFKKEVAEEATKKLREARKDQSREIEQQKAQRLKVKLIEPKCHFLLTNSPQAREDEIIISSPPSPDYPSGIIAIQVHQILGLGVKKVKRSQGDDGIGEDDDQVEGDDLLSSYCTVILNHQKALKTRTKPKSGKPSVCCLFFLLSSSFMNLSHRSVLFSSYLLLGKTTYVQLLVFLWRRTYMGFTCLEHIYCCSCMIFC